MKWRIRLLLLLIAVCILPLAGCIAPDNLLIRNDFSFAVRLYDLPGKPPLAEIPPHTELWLSRQAGLHGNDIKSMCFTDSTRRMIETNAMPSPVHAWEIAYGFTSNVPVLPFLVGYKSTKLPASLAYQSKGRTFTLTFGTPTGSLSPANVRLRADGLELLFAALPFALFGAVGLFGVGRWVIRAPIGKPRRLRFFGYLLIYAFICVDLWRRAPQLDVAPVLCFLVLCFLVFCLPYVVNECQATCRKPKP